MLTDSNNRYGGQNPYDSPDQGYGGNNGYGNGGGYNSPPAQGYGGENFGLKWLSSSTAY
ncbi:hypothetical protein FVER14953_20832 [Fusarium verticillioides]|nr:hypothetical protein FVER14953_20832 [Fusarium verticillioides]